MRRTPTADIWALAGAAKTECRELQALCDPRAILYDPDRGTRPPPPMGDPGHLLEGSRRAQAKHDLKFWREQRERLLDELGTLIAEGKVTV